MVALPWRAWRPLERQARPRTLAGALEASSGMIPRQRAAVEDRLSVKMWTQGSSSTSQALASKVPIGHQRSRVCVDPSLKTVLFFAQNSGSTLRLPTLLEQFTFISDPARSESKTPDLPAQGDRSIHAPKFSSVRRVESARGSVRPQCTARACVRSLTRARRAETARSLHPP